MRWGIGPALLCIGNTFLSKDCICCDRVPLLLQFPAMSTNPCEGGTKHLFLEGLCVPAQDWSSVMLCLCCLSRWTYAWTSRTHRSRLHAQTSGTTGVATLC